MSMFTEACFPRTKAGAPVSDTIFRELCEHPYGLTAAQLIEKIFRGVNEPDEYQVSARVAHMNRKMEQHRMGLRVRGHGGPGSIYLLYVVKEPRLEALQGAAAPPALSTAATLADGQTAAAGSAPR